MKMLLDNDQIKLLKMRSSKLINSDLDEKFNEIVYEKLEDEHIIQEAFVDNIRSKKLNKKDIKLL